MTGHFNNPGNDRAVQIVDVTWYTSCTSWSNLAHISHKCILNYNFKKPKNENNIAYCNNWMFLFVYCQGKGSDFVDRTLLNFELYRIQWQGDILNSLYLF